MSKNHNHNHRFIKHKHYPRLAFRMYVYGFTLLVAVAIGAGIAAHAVSADENEQYQHFPQRLSKLLSNKISEGDLQGQELKDFLQDVEFVADIHISVFDKNNKPVANTGKEILPALYDEEISKLGTLEHVTKCGWFLKPAQLTLNGKPNGYLIFGWEIKDRLAHVGAILLSIFIVLAILPIPFARGLGKPLEKMTETAKAIGKGDFSARTDIVRKDEIGVLAKTIDEMTDKIVKMIASEKELLANVSHELRTPLARVKIALELIQESEAATPDIEKRIDEIGNDLDELEQLIEDVFLSTRLTPGTEQQFPLRKEPSSISEIIKDSKERFENRHTSPKIDSSISVSQRHVNLDPKLIRRVLDNLLANAKKYSETDAPIKITAKDKDNQLVIDVIDNGKGVPEDIIDEIFEPFFQADKSRSKKKGGVGLGLTLCKRIIEAHGGIIEAKNHVDGGLVISFTLPIQEV